MKTFFKYIALLSMALSAVIFVFSALYYSEYSSQGEKISFYVYPYFWGTGVPVMIHIESEDSVAMTFAPKDVQPDYQVEISTGREPSPFTAYGVVDTIIPKTELGQANIRYKGRDFVYMLSSEKPFRVSVELEMTKGWLMISGICALVGGVLSIKKLPGLPWAIKRRLGFLKSKRSEM